MFFQAINAFWGLRFFPYDFRHLAYFKCLYHRSLRITENKTISNRHPLSFLYRNKKASSHTCVGFYFDLIWLRIWGTQVCQPFLISFIEFSYSLHILGDSINIFPVCFVFCPWRECFPPYSLGTLAEKFWEISHVVYMGGYVITCSTGLNINKRI